MHTDGFQIRVGRGGCFGEQSAFFVSIRGPKAHDLALLPSGTYQQAGNDVNRQLLADCPKNDAPESLRNALDGPGRCPHRPKRQASSGPAAGPPGR